MSVFAAADDYSGLIEAGRRAIFRTFSDAGIGDVEPQIVHEQVIPPAEVNLEAPPLNDFVTYQPLCFGQSIGDLQPDIVHEQVIPAAEV